MLNRVVKIYKLNHHFVHESDEFVKDMRAMNKLRIYEFEFESRNMRVFVLHDTQQK